SDENAVALGCLARDFVPNSVSFSWKLNNSTVSSENIRTFPQVLRDGLWSASSQLVLPSSNVPQGPDDSLVCEVQHPKGGKTVGTVRVTASKMDVSPPIVSVFVPPRSSLSGNGNSKSSLICQASDFSPKQISLSWLRDGKRMVSGISEGQVETVQSSPVTFRAYSVLTITESDWLSQSVYTCQVEHNKETFQKNASSACDAVPPSTTGVFTIPPSFADIFLTKSAKLSCLVTNLASYDGLNISWSRQNGKALETHTYFKRHLNDTFSATGEASVCSEDWESGEEFTCTVAHLDLPFPEKHTISKPKGSAEEEGFENLNTMASTFIVLFLLSLFYSTTVTLFKVGPLVPGVGRGHGPPAPPYPLTLCLLPAGEVTASQEHGAAETEQEGLPWGRVPGLCGLSACIEIFPRPLQLQAVRNWLFLERLSAMAKHGACSYRLHLALLCNVTFVALK
uniref:Ig-like domain-containing protein n=1 Tax=Moschus moschiferus TaxID=68415 RepID=A0A8C6EEW3_MOSMO